LIFYSTQSVREKEWNEGEGDDQERHRCLVRYVIRMRLSDRDRAHKWLNGKSDGKGGWVRGWNDMHPGSILERDVIEQWKRGNRGEGWIDS